jgi:predicted TPR repeat methyltransferase
VTNRKAIHERVLNASDKEELMVAYSEWAGRYDRDLLGEMGYVAPMIASKLLGDYLTGKGSRILDAGCGTGIVGECLRRGGYRNIEGLDYSQAMLEKARAKGIYTTLKRGDMTQPLGISDDTYDAIISVGTFTCGHVGPEALDELIRVTKPGGYVCFTVREQAWEKDHYRTRMRDIENDGIWELQELVNADYIQQEGARCKVCLYGISVHDA